MPDADEPYIKLEVQQSGHDWMIHLAANNRVLESGELQDVFRLFYNRAQQPTADSTLNKLSVAKRMVEYLNGELVAAMSVDGRAYFRLRLAMIN